MKRQALIIGAPADDIPGVEVDVKNYKNFLMSPVGGAWLESEIDVLMSPSALRLSIAQVPLKFADYSLCIFGGHGGHDKSIGKTLIKINANEKIDVQELNAGAPRHTVIVDSCRTHFRSLIVEAMRKAQASLENLADMDYARRVYNEHLEKCAPTIAKMYSCSDGEGALESDNGGLFSHSLLKLSRAWSDQSSAPETILEVNEAFNQAKAKVKNETGDRQNPEGMFLRTGPHFPFAVRSR